MEERPLGRSGLTVPVLGWGTVKIGRNEQVKYPEGFELPTDEQVEELVAVALDLGIRLFDTAPAYGSSESRLGRALVGRRDEVLLATKVGEEFLAGQSRYAFDRRSIVESVERSLRDLRTDRLDLLLLHSDGRDVHILEETDALAALEDLKTRGLVRATGISAKSAEGVRRASRELDVIMAPVTGQDARLTRELEQAGRVGCGILAIKVLGQGHALAGVDSLAARLHSVLGKTWVCSAVLGSCRPEHLRQWAQALPDSDDPGRQRASS